MMTIARRLALALSVAGATSAALFAQADAAAVPAAQPGLQRAPGSGGQRQLRPTLSSAPKSWQPHRLGQHVFYGKITAINGSIVTLHLRNGHILDVDAGAAIANGDYSAPLYVGKPVSVDGVEANGTFTAVHLFRVTNLNDLRSDK